MEKNELKERLIYELYQRKLKESNVLPFVKKQTVTGRSPVVLI